MTYHLVTQYYIYIYHILYIYIIFVYSTLIAELLCHDCHSFGNKGFGDCGSLIPNNYCLDNTWWWFHLPKTTNIHFLKGLVEDKISHGYLYFWSFMPMSTAGWHVFRFLLVKSNLTYNIYVFTFEKVACAAHLPSFLFQPQRKDKNAVERLKMDTQRFGQAVAWLFWRICSLGVGVVTKIPKGCDGMGIFTKPFSPWKWPFFTLM